MTTAQIESAANRGNIATADFVIGQVLRRQVIPQFLEDVGPCSWRKRYKTITTVAGTQAYDLDADCLKVWEAYRLISPGSLASQPQLKYIGEDPLAVAFAENTTTQAAPTGYYITLTGSALSGSGSATFGAIVDGAVGTATFTLAGAIVGSNVAPGWPAALPTGLVGSMRVSASNTIEVRLANASGASITPGTLTFTYAVLTGSQTGNVVATGTGLISGGILADGVVGQGTFFVTGATPGDNVAPGWPSGLPAGMVCMMRVSAAGIVQVRWLNLSGASITIPDLTYSATIITAGSNTPSAAWKMIKFQAPPDAAYIIPVVQQTFVPFGDDTTSVELSPYIPEQLHWALVDGLRAQIFFDRYGQGDPRYDRAQAAYGVPDNSDVGFSGWVGKARRQRELGRRNYFVSVR